MAKDNNELYGSIKPKEIAKNIGDVDNIEIFNEIDLIHINPAIIILEYNSVFGFERAITIPYRKDFNRTKALAKIIDGMAGVLKKLKPDILLLLGDALGSVAVIISGLIIKYTSSPYKYYADPICSLLIVAIIVTKIKHEIKSF